MTILRRRKGYYMHGEPEPLDLHETNLSGAILYGANLTGALLWKAKNLTQEQLEQAEGAESTRLPSHLKPPEGWSVKTDEQTEED